ncbi:hypothetical protein LCGC14_2950100, partial [marine sediment metagenome]
MTETDQITEKKEVKHQISILEFDCYEFYKFIESIEKYTNELELVFENREFYIEFMNASRIMMCKCSKSIDVIEPFEKMKFGINTRDFKLILKTRKKDKKTVELTFDNTKNHIELVKTSEAYNSKIVKTLNLLDLDLKVIPMDNLLKIEYPAKANFPISFLEDFFYESANYSEIVDIEINDIEGLIFSETGIIGTSRYLIENQYCNSIEGNERGAYSYTYLTPIKPLLPILVNSDIT